MNYIFANIFIILTLLSFCWVLGAYTNRFFFEKKFCICSNIVCGYSIFLLITFFLYFNFNFSIDLIIIIFFFIYFIFFFFIKEQRILFDRLFVFFVFLIIFLFFLPCYIYGEQFYVFRGNYWDSYNYISTAILFKNYTYNQILEKNYIKEFLLFDSINYYVMARPLANFIVSFFAKFSENSVFLAYFSTKIFFVLLTFFSLKVLFDDFLTSRISFILSFSFCVTFWNIYIFEIDALSHLASIPILIFSIKLVNLFYKFLTTNNYNNKLIFYFSFIFLSLFLVYPEINIVTFIIYFSFFLFRLKKIFKTNSLIKILKIIALLIILLLPSIKYYTSFVTNQINQAFGLNDWWGYFGAFILGKENLVNESQFVNEAKLFILNHDYINFVKYFQNIHFEKKYYFIYFNILPSILGFYFFLPGKIDSFFELIYSAISIIIIYYLLWNAIKKNFFFIIKNKFFKEITISVIFFIVLIVIFISKKSFWTIIKFYSYLLPFFFLLVIVDLKKKKINKILLILSLIFPFYKFTTFNYGISRLDSFPSIIKPIYKKKINWNLNVKDFEKCNYVELKSNDYFIRNYINAKVLNKNVNLFYRKHNLNEDHTCKISYNYKKNSFIVSK